MKHDNNGTVFICTACGRTYPDWFDGLTCENCHETLIEVEANPIIIRDTIRAIKAKNEPTIAG